LLIVLVKDVQCSPRKDIARVKILKMGNIAGHSNTTFSSILTLIPGLPDEKFLNQKFRLSKSENIQNFFPKSENNEKG